MEMNFETINSFCMTARFGKKGIFYKKNPNSKQIVINP